MTYTDNHNAEIKDGDALLFALEDSVEPTGFYKFVTPVQLCFYSEIEKRFIPLKENFTEGDVDAEIIKIQNPEI